MQIICSLLLIWLFVYHILSCPFGSIFIIVYMVVSGFSGLGVACWPLVLKFAGSNPAEDIVFLGRKNPHHAYLRRRSKAVGHMS